MLIRTVEQQARSVFRWIFLIWRGASDRVRCPTYHNRCRPDFTHRHFWGYFEPIREWMPKNCSADVEAVIKYIDETFDSGNATAIHDMKSIFGLEDIVHADDFGAASTSPQ